MALTLGQTGLVSTILGSAAGSTNTVYSQPVTGGGWMAKGSRTGDGNVTLSLTSGFYFLYCLSVLGGVQSVSNIVQLTVNADSLYGDCGAAIQAEIQSLGLTGLPGGSPLPNGQVYFKRAPVADVMENVTLPAVIVCLPTVPESQEYATNEADDVGYPWLVAILANPPVGTGGLNSAHDITAGDVILLWREQIRKVFHYKEPGLIVSALSKPLKWILWEPQPAIDWAVYAQKNIHVSAAVVRVVPRVNR